GAGHDLLKRRDVPVEGRAPGGGQRRGGTRSLAHKGLADLDIARFLERGQLFGQRRVGEADVVADEREVGPLGCGEQGDDRQTGRRVDQFVEAWRGHPVTPERLSSMMRRSVRMSHGPPATSRIAPNRLPSVAECGTSAAFRPKATPREPPTVSSANPAISRPPRQPSSWLRTWTRMARRSAHARLARTPATNSAVPTPITSRLPDSTAAARPTTSAPSTHQNQVGTNAALITCS